MNEPPASPRPRGWPTRFLAAATAVYAGVLVWATHHPQPQKIVGPNPPSDKLLHVFAYALLGALVAATLASAGRLGRRSAALMTAGLAAFAALDEATQPLPWFRRAADPLDWVFDLVGIALGAAAVWLLAAAVGCWRNRATPSQ